jgi:hypothetical protein
MVALEKLDAEQICRTSEQLQRRIGERFPGSGLLRVAGQLVELASRAKATTEWIGRPNTVLRISSYVVVGAMLVSLALLLAESIRVGGAEKRLGLGELVQISEATMNGLVLLGAAVWFFVSFETRFKRGRVLKALQSLRTLAHLIDVHQLTKDPDVLDGDARRTASSPSHDLTPFELGRYLDYCTEMLSLSGKIAALYSEGFDDPAALDAVTDLEGLTNALQHKIWQKIVLLESRAPTTSASPSP